MTRAEADALAAIARRRLSLVHNTLPPEGPRDFIANAVQALVGHEAAHPAVWEYSPELRRVEALLFKALYALDREHSA